MFLKNRSFFNPKKLCEVKWKVSPGVRNHFECKIFIVFFKTKCVQKSLVQWEDYATRYEVRFKIFSFWFFILFFSFLPSFSLYSDPQFIRFLSNMTAPSIEIQDCNSQRLKKEDFKIFYKWFLWGMKHLSDQTIDAKLIALFPSPFKSFIFRQFSGSQHFSHIFQQFQKE